LQFDDFKFGGAILEKTSTRLIMIIQKEHGLKLLLIFLSIVLTLSALEISFRIIGKLKGIDFSLYIQELQNPDRLPENMLIGTYNNYILRPNSQFLASTSDFSVIYSINSQGFRDKEYAFEKPHHYIRILAFGDSYTFGEGIKYGKRFTDIPESYFPNLELLNFGVPGYSLNDAIIFFKNIGLKFDADYLFIFINTPFIMRSQPALEAGCSKDVYEGSKESPLSYLLTLHIDRDDIFFKKNKSIANHSFLLSYIKYRIRLFMLKKQFMVYDKSLWHNILSKQDTQINSLVIDNTKKLIVDLNEICKANHKKLVVINICHINEMNFMFDLSQDIQFIDLAKELKAKAKKYSITFKYDPHFNYRAHDFIGRRLIEIIESFKNT
jgi:hypothetical protein